MTTTARKYEINRKDLHDTATAVYDKKQKAYEAKKRKKMTKYRKACQKAAKKGKFSQTFRAGYGIFYPVSPIEFQCYFSWDKEFEIKIKKHKVTISW